MCLNKCILFFLILFLSSSIVLAQEVTVSHTILKSDVSEEEISAYKPLAVEFIRKTKGWEPEEYKLEYRMTLSSAPLATLDAMRYDALQEMKMTKKKRLGFHPTGEVRVYIQTEEMRAFSDYDEFYRIKEEAEEKLAEEKLKGE